MATPVELTPRSSRRTPGRADAMHEISDDGATIATFQRYGAQLQLRCAATGALLWEHAGAAGVSAVSLAGGALLFATMDNRYGVVSTTGAAEVTPSGVLRPAHEETPFCCAASPDGRSIMAGNAGYIDRLRVSDGLKERIRFEDPEDGAADAFTSSCAFASQAPLFVSCHHGFFVVWLCFEAEHVPIVPAWMTRLPVAQHECVFSPEGREILVFGGAALTLAPGSVTETAATYVALFSSSGTGMRRVVHAPGYPPATAGAFSADGRRVLAAFAGAVTVWDRASLDPLLLLRGGGGPAAGPQLRAAFTAAGSVVAVDGEGTVHTWPTSWRAEHARCMDAGTREALRTLLRCIHRRTGGADEFWRAFVDRVMEHVLPA